MAHLDAIERPCSRPAAPARTAARGDRQRQRDDRAIGLELAAVDPHAHPPAGMVDGTDGRAQPHAVAEPLGHGEREALVAAGEPVAGQRLERGGVLEHAGRQPLGLEAGRDLDAREHRLRDVRRQPGAADQLRHGAGAARRGRARDHEARGLRGRHVDGDAARLAHVVAHPRAGELEPVAACEAPQLGVAGEHELGAPLDHAARRPHAVRPHAAAHAVARLEHEHVEPPVGQLGRGGEAREPGADDDRAIHAAGLSTAPGATGMQPRRS